jgi:hypothetical protein
MDVGVAIKFSRSHERASITASSNFRYGSAPGMTVCPDCILIHRLTLCEEEPSTVVHCASRWISERLDVQG